MKRVSYFTAMLCGTWTAAKMPQIDGNYSGNVFSNSNPSQAIPVTATITAHANFNITGHASVSSLCFNQLTLSGLQVGGAGEFVGTDPQGDSVTFLFISKDATFGSIQGDCSVTAGLSLHRGYWNRFAYEDVTPVKFRRN